MIKKIFSLFTALLFVGTMWATDPETFDFSGGVYSGSGNTAIITWEGTSCTIVQSKGESTTNVNSSYTGTNLRWYASHYITFTPKSGVTITKVVLTGKSGKTGQTMTKTADSGAASITTTAATYVTEVTGSWTPSSVLELKMGTQFQLTSVVITYSTGGSDPVAVTGVTLDESTIELEVGETQTLTATVAPASATVKTVSWESNHEEIATVDENGVVTAVAAGSATITVTTTDGSFTATCEVTVTPALPKSSLIFTAACGGSGTADDGAKWTVESDASESTFDSDNGRGIHYGTNDKAVEYIHLSTSDIDGIIRKVVVNASALSDATVSVTVGGDAFGGAAKALTSTATAYTFKGSASGEIVVAIEKPSSAKKALYCKSIIVSYEVPAVAQPTITPATTNFIGSVEVSLTCSTDGASIYYTTKESAKATPATSGDWSAYNSAAKPSFSATTTIWAAAKNGDDWSSVASKTYTLVPVAHAGTSADPYSIADARTAIEAGVGTSDVYVAGIISQVDSYNETYHSITYWISEDGTTTDQFKVYGGKGLNGADFSAVTDLSVGGEVVVKGNITKYNDVDEFDSGNELHSIQYPASIICASNTLNILAAGGDGVLNVTYNYVSATSAQIAFYEADGTTPATYDWVDAEINEGHNVAYEIAANASTDPRNAYFKVYVGEVYSGLVTIAQDGYVPDYATLPFAFNGGRSAIATTNGLTQEGLDTDYSSAPKMKFNSADDYVLLKINETPGILTFDIKANPSSGKSGIEGTFKVQTSANGSDFEDLETYTDFSGTLSGESFNLASTVRYVKWIYTSRTSGNVALGNIALAKPVFTVKWSLGAGADESLGELEKMGESDSYTKYFDKDILTVGTTYTVKVFKDDATEPITTTNLAINEEVGKYHIEFDYDASQNKLEASATRTGTTTAVDNTEISNKAVKFIQNGQLFIELNGHIYNVQGQVVK